MKNFLSKLSYNLQYWARNRYGNDSLSWTLIIVGCLLSLVTRFTGIRIFWTIGLMLMVFGLYRTYSTKYDQRRKELEWFQRTFKGPISWVSLTKRKAGDKTHKYVKCPTCGTVLRVPKGKGKIVITCPTCSSKVETKS